MVSPAGRKGLTSESSTPDSTNAIILTTHIVGNLHGPLGFDLSTGTGVQQVEHGTPIKPALLFSPAFTLKATPRLTLTLGYTHYDSSQALGTLSGNAVRLSTDLKF